MLRQSGGGASGQEGNRNTRILFESPDENNVCVCMWTLVFRFHSLRCQARVWFRQSSSSRLVRSSSKNLPYINIIWPGSCMYTDIRIVKIFTINANNNICLLCMSSGCLPSPQYRMMMVRCTEMPVSQSHRHHSVKRGVCCRCFAHEKRANICTVPIWRRYLAKHCARSSASTSRETTSLERANDCRIEASEYCTRV